MKSPLAALLAIALSLSATGAQAEAPIFGVWRNPKNTVHIDIRRCGAESACGVVIWASAKAQKDAREGSGKELVGLTLFRDMVRTDDGTWRGKVFVPDVNRTFTGSARPLDGSRLQARGCLFANVICKSQTWVRLDEDSRAAPAERSS